jgi:hypothetical protein
VLDSLAALLALGRLERTPAAVADTRALHSRRALVAQHTEALVRACRRDPRLERCGLWVPFYGLAWLGSYLVVGDLVVGSWRCLRSAGKGFLDSGQGGLACGS